MGVWKGGRQDEARSTLWWLILSSSFQGFTILSLVFIFPADIGGTSLFCLTHSAFFPAQTKSLLGNHVMKIDGKLVLIKSELSRSDNVASR